VRYRFIQEEQAHYPVRLLCRVMQVSRSGFYAWRKRPKSVRAKRDEALTDRIRAIHVQSRSNYGVPRIHAELRDQQLNCGKKRVARLMRSAGLRGKCKGENRRRSKGGLPAPNNLLSGNFSATELNTVWISGITYLPTQEGWRYLAVVLDVFSRRVVGWAMQASMTTALTLAALHMACKRRNPPPGLIHHSDRGGQYVGGDYQSALRAAGMLISTSSHCLENALAESFFATLKTGEVQDEPYETREQARRCVFDYLEVFYNRQRRHSSLGFQSPAHSSSGQQRLTGCLQKRCGFTAWYRRPDARTR
jgi:putative transposase